MSWYRQQMQKGADRRREEMKLFRQKRLAMEQRRKKYTMNQPFDYEDIEDEMDFKRSMQEKD